MFLMQNNMNKKQKLLQRQVKLEAVTIATNMAGRGTDIKLGGNKDFLKMEKNDIKEFKKNELKVKDFRWAFYYWYRKT